MQRQKINSIKALHMRLTNGLWKKALLLETNYTDKGDTLSRDKIKKELSVCERDARYIFELLRDRSVVLATNGYREQASLTSQNRKLRNSLREATLEITKLVRTAELHADIRAQTLEIPQFARPGNAPSKAIACSMLSDTHFDEVVNPAEIGYVNAYNRDIATMRLERYFRSLVKLKDVHFSGIDINGLVLMLAGDMVSGMIHDELRATNQFAITDTIVYYAELMVAGINMIQESYKELFVPCVVGNHGRLTEKIKFKGAVADNFDYLFYQMIAAQLKSNKHIRFYIPVSPDAIFPASDTTFCLTHGNQFRGGSGWSGPLLPLMRGDTKKRERQSTVKLPYDVICSAHFHSLKFLGKQIINGSVIGYGEFASDKNFEFDVPRQAYWLVDKRGVGVTSPVHCKAEFEPWEADKPKAMFGV